mmetsp:Transcript_6223/g.13135  ORF Transcript_6223/g.13135 Transcript_6223/m.13135 type:complete len:122 (-) Transcript_6223:1029-1394(-)
MLMMLDVSQSNLERVFLPALVDPSRFKNKLSNDVLLVNASASIDIPSSSILIEWSERSFKVDLSDWIKVDSDLTPAIVNAFLERLSVSRLVFAAAVSPDTKAAIPSSPMALSDRSKYFSSL